MNDKVRPRHLGLVPQHQPSPPTSEIDVQLELPIGDGEYARVIVINMMCVDGGLFRETIGRLSPSVVIDMRTVPSFAIGGFSRRHAFDLFGSVEAEYRDVCISVDVHQPADSGALQSGRVVATVNRLLVRKRIDKLRVAILVDAEECAMWVAQYLPSRLDPIPPGGWTVDVVPRPRLKQVK